MADENKNTTEVGWNITPNPSTLTYLAESIRRSDSISLIEESPEFVETADKTTRELMYLCSKQFDLIEKLKEFPNKPFAFGTTVEELEALNDEAMALSEELDSIQPSTSALIKSKADKSEFSTELLDLISALGNSIEFQTAIHRALRTLCETLADTIHAEDARKVVDPINQALTTMPINHSFAVKVFEGIEVLAYSGKGQYELTTRKKGSKERTLLNVTPELAAEYIKNEYTNGELLARILSTVKNLLKQPEAIAKRKGVRSWITTETIIKELSRTAKGTNRCLPKNEAYRKAVMDGLSVLSNASIQSFDAKGRQQFIGSVLHAEYLAEITDKAGNTIKDVWGFDATDEGAAWDELMEQYTINARLLDMKPLKATNAWIPQTVQGLIISKLHAELYPKRGKGRKKSNVKLKWSEIFKSANVKADGELDSKVKNRIVADFESVLEAAAKAAADHEEHPIWIEATSTRNSAVGRGKGEWLNLEVTGYKTLRKVKIDLQTNVKRKPEKD